jgi:hypothetical protein
VSEAALFVVVVGALGIIALASLDEVVFFSSLRFLLSCELCFVACLVMLSAIPIKAISLDSHVPGSLYLIVFVVSRLLARWYTFISVDGHESMPLMKSIFSWDFNPSYKLLSDIMKCVMTNSLSSGGSFLRR